MGAFWLLSGYDKNGREYIERFGADKIVTQKQTGEKTALNTGDTSDLSAAVAKGLKNECKKIVERLLSEGENPLSIVDEKLVPALDRVGERFEKGEVFLPQLIQSAGAAQAAFEVIRQFMAKSGEESESKGRVVLATVKGDIHDIGKNIVKTLLENYGFEVIDLGKDVDHETVADAAVKYNVKLVGLSALMTTTLKSMENTIKLIRERNIPCKVVVGGAVLTPEYADKIGADFYAKDAKETVDIARRVYECG